MSKTFWMKFLAIVLILSLLGLILVVVVFSGIAITKLIEEAKPGSTDEGIEIHDRDRLSHEVSDNVFVKILALGFLFLLMVGIVVWLIIIKR
jgi:hypothetical protein